MDHAFERGTVSRLCEVGETLPARGMREGSETKLGRILRIMPDDVAAILRSDGGVEMHHLDTLEPKRRTFDDAAREAMGDRSNAVATVLILAASVAAAGGLVAAVLSWVV